MYSIHIVLDSVLLLCFLCFDFLHRTSGTEFEAQAAAPEEKRQRVSFNSVVQKVEDPWWGRLRSAG